jgi:hypothetical protein
VLGGRFEVPVVELLLIDSLFDEKDIGPQLQDRIELSGRESIPGPANHGTIRHGVEFNGRYATSLWKGPLP